MDSFSQFPQISQKLLKTYYLDNDDMAFFLCNIFTGPTGNLKVAWRKAMRGIYKRSPRTHNIFFLPFFFNNMYIEMILAMRIFKFYQTIVKTNYNAVKSVARCGLYQSTSNTISNMQIKHSSFVKNIVTNNGCILAQFVACSAVNVRDMSSRPATYTEVIFYFYT